MTQPPLVVPTSIQKRLSPRMAQTLAHLLNGLSEKEVALAMDVSQHTVHGYTKALYKQLGVQSRAELLLRLFHEMRVEIDRLHVLAATE